MRSMVLVSSARAFMPTSARLVPLCCRLEKASLLPSPTLFFKMSIISFSVESSSVEGIEVSSVEGIEVSSVDGTNIEVSSVELSSVDNN